MTATMALAAESVIVAAEPITPPPIIRRQVSPLERPATTEEIMRAIDHCMEAVGPDRSLNPRRLNELGWSTGASERAPGGEAITQYFRGNVVNDIAILPRVASCTTKAKLENRSQVDEIRRAMMARYGLARMEDFNGKDGLKKAMIERFGDSVGDIMLMRAGNSFTIEPTKTDFGDFVAITNIPDVHLIPPAAN